MRPARTLRSLDELAAVVKKLPPKERLGSASLTATHPLSRCHNALDQIDGPGWSFDEAYAEIDGVRFAYPGDYQCLLRLLKARYAEQPIEAGQLLALLLEVEEICQGQDYPMPRPIGTRVIITHEGEDFHQTPCNCGLCNSNGHASEFRIWEVMVNPVGDVVRKVDDEDSFRHSDDPLHTEYAPSEGAAEANCLLLCDQLGWVVVN